MKQQLITMLELQDGMNSKVNANWREMNFEWYRAIWVECAETLDHYGWKWWKKQTPDMAQIQLELVDIWHFGLSILLLAGNSSEQVADQVAEALAEPREAGDFRLDLEAFTAATLTSKQFDVNAFAQLMCDVAFPFDQLYCSYVGKNVLNFFRQDHGYQDGSYRKQWGGREDNEHLVEIVAMLDAHSASFKDDLYAAMQARYNSLN